MTYRRRIHIEAPVAAVFGFFRDPDNWVRLAPKGVRFTDVKATEEGLGTHYCWAARIAGISVEGFDVFTEFVPDRRITDRSSSSLEGTWRYSFEPDGSGTMLAVENQVGGLWRLPALERLVDRMTAQTHDPLFARLKIKLEE